MRSFGPHRLIGAGLWCCLTLTGCQMSDSRPSQPTAVSRGTVTAYGNRAWPPMGRPVAPPAMAAAQASAISVASVRPPAPPVMQQVAAKSAAVLVPPPPLPVPPPVLPPVLPPVAKSDAHAEAPVPERAPAVIHAARATAVAAHEECQLALELPPPRPLVAAQADAVARLAAEELPPPRPKKIKKKPQVPAQPVLAKAADAKPPIPAAPPTPVPTPSLPRQLPSDNIGRAQSGHAADYTWISGEVQKWRKEWRLRYASVDEVDPYGGSLTLVGEQQLSQLCEGEHYKLMGHVVAHDHRTGGPAFQVEGFQPAGH